MIGAKSEIARWRPLHSYLFWFALIATGLSFLSKFLFFEVSYESPDHGGVFSGIFLIDLALSALWLIAVLSAAIFGVLLIRSTGGKSLLPLVITLLPMVISPAGLWISYNHKIYDAERAAFAKKLRAAESRQPDRCRSETAVSTGTGARLSLERQAEIKCTPIGIFVLFPTWHGIPDGFSGFVYAPEKGDPKKDWPELRLEWSTQMDETNRIFHVGNR